MVDMNEMKDRFGGSIDKMKDHFKKLKSLAKSGKLDDKAREELEALRSHFEKKPRK